MPLKTINVQERNVPLRGDKCNLIRKEQDNNRKREGTLECRGGWGLDNEFDSRMDCEDVA